MNLANRIVRGDQWRRTRFQDMRGNPVGIRSLAALPQIAFHAAVREVGDWRPTRPWIPYEAAAAIARRLRPCSRVLEFGAGMSTIWFAQRCQFVRSVENDAGWYDRVSRILEERRIVNVRLDHATGDAYTRPAGSEPGSFEFVLIDGILRDQCVTSSIDLVARPGHTYLDDIDFATQWEMYARAEALLAGAAVAARACVTRYTGFTPATVIARQGMLVDWPA